MKKWLSRHKKLVIVLVVLAVLLTAFLIMRHKAQQALSAMQNQVQTAAVERRDLTQTITATGVVDSDNSTVLKTTLTNAEVKTVDVEVGDVITAGQTICTFDTEDISQNLTDARINLSVTNSQSVLTLGNAERNVSDAETTRDYQLTTAQKDMNEAFDDYQDALSDYTEAQQDLADLQDDEADLEDTYDTAERKYEAVKDDYQEAANAYNRAQNDNGAQQAEVANRKAEADAYADDDLSDEAAEARQAYNASLTELAQLQIALNNAEQDYLELKSDYDVRYANYTTAKADYEAKKTEREAQETKTDTYKSSLDQSEQAYDKAASSYSYTQSSQDSSVAGSESALSNSQLSASTAGQSYADLIDTYTKQLAKGVLASPVSGTVTAVDLDPGDLYAGGPIVTVEDCDVMIVAADIDEYDIADVKLGMKATFTTDATRDEVLQGQVIYVAPRPSDSTSGDVTYQVKISVETPTERLRLGMSAKVSIIVSETANVLTVPYDAVQTDASGNEVVYVLEDSASPTDVSTGATTTGATLPGAAQQRAIPVAIGVQGDYYVEISGDGLKEGMQVVLPDSDYVDPFSNMMAF